MAVDGRPEAGVGFATVPSLLEAFLIKLIGDFLPLDCVLPVVKTLVSKSTRTKSKSHII
jgi:hypothetical protein